MATVRAGLGVGAMPFRARDWMLEMDTEWQVSTMSHITRCSHKVTGLGWLWHPSLGAERFDSRGLFRGSRGQTQHPSHTAYSENQHGRQLQLIDCYSVCSCLRRPMAWIKHSLIIHGKEGPCSLCPGGFSIAAARASFSLKSLMESHFPTGTAKNTGMKVWKHSHSTRMELRRASAKAPQSHLHQDPSPMPWEIRENAKISTKI